ncbi:hypothetical protein PCANC_20385 [Puccinia coronata f. sp. avenae]|uniref:Uncharacterized protein n=1 Tax=Puccinia coronata f. sp. avenae TaxID=200324 RepID=A0A2N5UEN8_9BASI|nr:hypothetical protein PCANC_26413 [Puccinia coronata f. sp. avenae]PLW21171.1 hypothetical protein PCASD_18783 [Puccinia coronata f. sp. avenae]PLW36212.1 hypothetical protein PCANC_20385 [Puccinia coronata f. sp. avenae]PLW38957.1 hypothetical protein PCASD_11717 [Puccinia coronata f. sp. avenae]
MLDWRTFLVGLLWIGTMIPHGARCSIGRASGATRPFPRVIKKDDWSRDEKKSLGGLIDQFGYEGEDLGGRRSSPETISHRRGRASVTFKWFPKQDN